MTHRTDGACSRDIVARWCVLAEQRLEHLTELFETGRWRRYHSERGFLENIQEAKAAVETWRSLVTREAALDNSAVDMSWLSHTTAALPRREPLSNDPVEPQPVLIAAEPAPCAVPEDILAALESELIVSDEAPSAPDADEPPLPALDWTQRYPSLRNAL